MIAKRAFFFFLLLASGFVSRSSWAQVTVKGQVSDSTGALIPGVPIHFTRLGGSFTEQAVSDKGGQFRLADIRPGRYMLTTEAHDGFAAFSKIVEVGEAAPPLILIELAVASITQETSADASDRQLSTDPSDNHDQVVASGDMLAHVPVLDQNYIAALTPFLDQAGIATSGASIIVDGVEMKGTGVSASAIQEARINNDPYSVETNVPGKGRIEIMTKPGTPTLHGKFNFGFRDSAVDATTYFATVKPQEQKRIYEGSITGPVFHLPRTMFLVSGTRQEDDLQAIVHAIDPSGPIDQNVPTPIRDTEVAVRATYDFTPMHRASFQYNVSDVITRNQGVGGLVEAQSGVNAQAREDDIIFNDRMILGPTLLNQLMFMLEKDHNPTRSVLEAPKIVIDGSATFGGAQADILNTENNMKFNDTVSWSHGRHYFKFGVNVPNVSRRAWEDHSNELGTFSFSSVQNYDASAPSPYAFTQQQGPGRSVFWWVEFGAFAQDQIKLSSNLQLSAGIRYDWQTYFPSARDVAPRVSLVYSPGGRSTVLRAGAGLYYDRSGALPIADLTRYNGVILRSYTILNPGYPNPLPSGESLSNLPTNLDELERASHMPMTLHYSAAIEHAIQKNATLSATYRGMAGEDLFRSRDVNAPLPPSYITVPNPQLGFVRQIEFEGRQLQNALDLTLEGKIDRWFSGVAQYTWSHTNNDTGGIAWFPANQYDNSGEYSRANFDQHHRFNLLGTFNEGHWVNLGLAVNLYSGTPYTETSGADTYNIGLSNARPAGVARNTLQSGGYADVDARWARDVYFTHKKSDADPHMSISLDSFNLPNRVNYSSYVGNIQSAFFGMPTTALPARRLQLTVGFTF
ncbi:TonB-dependent receptor domain-containing protein [Acidicapsa dinghuensis]|uniref:TonB-dependent receptor domain-containing protein n=1 Tax=Acidicapsa dinghuensis TaxID=2218256 RepID=A0ABW1EBY7_9BACT|nr:TonB-dependent receptor [Acidicapsa dinghuensis]